MNKEKKKSDDELKSAAQARVTEIQSKGDGYIKKVNLVHEGEGNEGIWVCLATEEDKKKYESDSSRGETCEGYLVNMPLGWGTACWGSKITFKTNGDSRAYARLSEQRKEFDADNKELYAGLVLLDKEKKA